MKDYIPPQPPKSHRIVLELLRSQPRLDNPLLEALKAQPTNSPHQLITRSQFKELFKTGRVLIKGQRAGPSSSLAKGITYIDILDKAPKAAPKEVQKESAKPKRTSRN